MTRLEVSKMDNLDRGISKIVPDIKPCILYLEGKV